MKIYAFFLPQFHQIKENDEWWGKGFTEWTNLYNSKNYFSNFPVQKPLNDNYYNLLNKDTVLWQTSLMNQYGVDGLIYYHYYFNGKLLMEKPAENLLKWKDIRQNFFFCWANHSFTRGNGSGDMLLKQEYGNKEDWERHFQYLLKFFNDDRYLKISNMPVLMLFKSDFSSKNQMFDYFNRRCKDLGFSGLYLIETYHGENWPEGYKIFKDNLSSICKSVFFREPAFAQYLYLNSLNKPSLLKYKITHKMNEIGAYKKPLVFKGDDLIDIKIESEPNDKKIIHGMSFCWDNTPRYGYKGYIITPISESKGEKYFKKIMGEEFLFINAWNEWSEGMVLEPSAQNKYKYLELLHTWKMKYCNKE